MFCVLRSYRMSRSVGVGVLSKWRGFAVQRLQRVLLGALGVLIKERVLVFDQGDVVFWEVTWRSSHTRWQVSEYKQSLGREIIIDVDADNISLRVVLELLTVAYVLQNSTR